LELLVSDAFIYLSAGVSFTSSITRTRTRHGFVLEPVLIQNTKRRILCVDDDPDTCWMLSLMLGNAGYEVKSASGITEGLKLAKSERFDLYLLDRTFADGTGVELCRRIREFDPQTPVVFFSGLAYESDRQLGLEAGAQEYLIKPDDLIRLIDTVQRLLLFHSTANALESSPPPQR
jgi:DNA-binding response OmpR family regulator